MASSFHRKNAFILICTIIVVSVIQPILTQNETSENTSSEWTSDKDVSITMTEAPAASSASDLSPQILTTKNEKMIYTYVCNMSLSNFPASPGGQEVEQKCSCSNIDVLCRYLGITDLPSLISFPNGYHVANFEGNSISNLNADTFYSGRDILELDMSQNRIDFVSSKTFLALKKLRNLDLSHNRIWNLPASAFEGLTNLQRLDLSFNDIFSASPQLFAPLQDLRQLMLESNPLQELQPKHFEHLSKLEDLDLESTLLKLLPDHLFVFTPHLKHLDLANNQLEEVPTEALHVLDHLNTLDLSGNPIHVIRAEAFRGMLGPVVLYLDRMPHLERIEKYAFGDAVHLQELHCSYNFKLDDIDEHAFVRKTDNDRVTLSQLFLRQNALSEVPRDLQPWSDSLELHFRGNPLHCDCQAQWLLSLRLKNDFQSDTRCESPADVSKLALAELRDASLHCGMEFSEIVLVTCAALLGFLLLVAVVAFVWWRRGYRGYSRPYYVPRNVQADELDYKCGDDNF